MRRVSEFALGFLVAASVSVFILALTADPQTYHQICETNQYSGKESCAPHNVIYVLIWYVGHWFDVSSAVITAIATAFIARFTFTLKRSTDNLYAASERQFRLANDEFIASRPPILEVRFVALNYDPQPFIEFTVINIGKSAGTVTGSSVSAEPMEDRDWPNPHDPTEYPMNNVVPLRRFGVGATDRLTVATSDAVNVATVALDTASKLRFYGYIVYEDKAGNPFTKFFFRTYDRVSDRFIPSDNPDYESND